MRVGLGKSSGPTQSLPRRPGADLGHRVAAVEGLAGDRGGAVGGQERCVVLLRAKRSL